MKIKQFENIKEKQKIQLKTEKKAFCVDADGQRIKDAENL